MYKAIGETGNPWFNVYSEDGTLQGIIHPTQHPTIRYEVFWDKSGKSERCETIKEGVLIIERDHKLHLLRVLQDFVKMNDDEAICVGAREVFCDAEKVLRDNAHLLV